MDKLIYVVEDEAPIRELYACTIEGAGMRAVCFEDGATMLNVLGGVLPDLFILDIMLDGMDGFEILQKLKENPATAILPVIMVSAKGEELSKVKGLNMGADDYISKPFGVLELVARIKANLRKTAASPLAAEYLDIAFDESAHQLKVNGKECGVTLKEYNLLKLLVQNAGKLTERETIFKAVWGDDFFGETRTLDIHINSLRKKLADSGSICSVKTVRGVGYILK